MLIRGGGWQSSLVAHSRAQSSAGSCFRKVTGQMTAFLGMRLKSRREDSTEICAEKKKSRDEMDVGGRKKGGALDPEDSPICSERVPCCQQPENCNVGRRPPCDITFWACSDVRTRPEYYVIRDTTFVRLIPNPSTTSSNRLFINLIPREHLECDLHACSFPGHFSPEHSPRWSLELIVYILASANPRN